MRLKFQPEADPPMAEIPNTKYPPGARLARGGKIQNTNTGFTLIELMVAMFIFVLLMGAMVAVSMAGFRSYIKSKAVKTVTEDVGFAINSIAKDVRMGKIESANVSIVSSPSAELFITRNSSQEKVCYLLLRGTDNDYLAVNSSVSPTATSCPAYSSAYKKIIDLSGTGMKFDATSGFRNQKTEPISSPTVRGWVEINLNIASPSMETDSISAQTTVSSRDYGWEEVAP